MHVVSVATTANWPQAYVMARSLHRHQPDWMVEIALLGSARRPRSDDKLLKVVSVETELGLSAEELLARYGTDAIIAAMAPRLLQARSGSGYAPVVHMPASALILGDLEPLRAPLNESAVLLARRAAEDPPDDGLEPSAHQLLARGRIAPDLMAVDGSTQAQSFLSWWIQRLEIMMGGSASDPRGPAGQRQWLYRSLELAPTLFSTAMLEDPGCNLSVWNLHEHSLAEVGGAIVVDGASRLRFLELSGFEPDRPFQLSPNSSRVRLSRSPVLRAISARYAQELREAGWSHVPRRSDVGRRLASGVVYDEVLERMHTEAEMLGERFGEVFSPDGSRAFMAWVTGPAPRGGAHGVNRYVFHRVHRERSDVTAAFPDLDGRDGPAFIRWCLTHGRREMGFPPELLPTEPAAAPEPAAPDPAPPASGNGASLQRELSGALSPPPAAALDASAPGVRLSGYLGHVLGLGSAARGYARALATAGIPLSTVSVDLDHLEAPVLLAADYGRHSHEDVLAERAHAFELVCVNPDELPRFIERVGEDYFSAPRIGVWGWEVNTIPARWARAFSLVDEIWVYSRFVAENIGAVAKVPVVALPPPVKAPADTAPWRLGVPEGFLFLFIFDYLSTIQRKNPIGLIEAFKRAFEPGEGPRLLIKTINAPLRPLHEEALLWAAEGRPDIHVIDRSLTGQEKDALIAGCDCYVSLHRSEGFGLTLAEAMSVGKPVIGTAYSGNVDFMNVDNSFLVDHQMTRVGADCEIYPAEAEWADPSLEHAAALMRRVYDDPDQAIRIGVRAQDDIARMLSPEATGAAMRRRLEQLAAGRPKPSRRWARVTWHAVRT